MIKRTSYLFLTQFYLIVDSGTPFCRRIATVNSFTSTLRTERRTKKLPKQPLIKKIFSQFLQKFIHFLINVLGRVDQDV